MDQPKQLHNLYAQLNRLNERVETQARYAEVVERKLREAMQLAGLSSPAVEVCDPIPRLNGGASDSTEVPASGRRLGDGPGAHMARDAAGEDAWWPRAEATPRSLVPNAGWQNYSLQGWVKKVIGISVCGLPRGVLEGVVASVAEQQARLRDFAPVFLTDSADFDVFRRHGFVFEYLPPPHKQAGYAGTLSWSDYAARRRALIERKWGLDHVVCFGSLEFGRAVGLLAAPPAAAEAEASSRQNAKASRKRPPRSRAANGAGPGNAPMVRPEIEATVSTAAARRRRKQDGVTRHDGEAKAGLNGSMLSTGAASVGPASRERPRTRSSARW